MTKPYTTATKPTTPLSPPPACTEVAALQERLAEVVACHQADIGRFVEAEREAVEARLLLADVVRQIDMLPRNWILVMYLQAVPALEKARELVGDEVSR